MSEEINKGGRPRIKIDAGKLDGMLTYGATAIECADQLNCSVDTIERFIKRNYKCGFAEYAEKKKAGMRVRLRMKQLQMAMEGNVPLLIFLGKNMLGQSDQQTITQTSNVVQLKYALQGTPDELRKQIKLAKEIEGSEESSTDEGHSES